MICLTPKPSQKISEIIGVSLSIKYKIKKKFFLQKKELVKEKGELAGWFLCLMAYQPL